MTLCERCGLNPATVGKLCRKCVTVADVEIESARQPEADASSIVSIADHARKSWAPPNPFAARRAADRGAR